MTAEFLQHLESVFAFDRRRLVEDLTRTYRESLEDPCTFLPSHVDSPSPSGKEEEEEEEEARRVLAIDMGGTHLRCAMVQTSRDTVPAIIQMRVWIVPDVYKHGHAQDLFDWIVQCLSTLIPPAAETTVVWRLGVAFSFPVAESSVKSGQIQTMGKHYDLTFSSAGRCLGALLTSSIARAKLNVALVACVNDSTATLLSTSRGGGGEPVAGISLLVGTGCNAGLYMPKTKLPAAKTRHVTTAAAPCCFVNSEVSLMGQALLPCTMYDAMLREAQCGHQWLEYATSGPYLGELVRLVLLNASKCTQVFAGCNTAFRCGTMALTTEKLAHLETIEHASEMMTFLDAACPLAPMEWTLAQVAFIKRVSKIVFDRSAALIATSVVALDNAILKSGPTRVACCGSVIEKYPSYLETCQKEVDELGASLMLHVSRDSGILGAAVAASTIGHTEKQTSL